MRHIGSTLTALGAAGLLALAVPSSALAANGFLVIDGVRHDSPQGCFEVTHLSTVFNVTDIPALVHNVPGCAGTFVQVIPPGLAVQVPGTHSVFMGEPAADLLPPA
ncbi:hypothetical protein GCM10018980_53750 [Streptomyces capoamus]|uniref:Secreted protein n=1 Tax=Streptomyces capoamus TaxID=68183 RepID=A0A919EZI0_9ACTN|nr:hypothetical protein [Streptomyces capoamus]GGW18059.1 hypothetical protein GCM10010501_42150 [Streptomyces libani subsp. rufus]GHG63300.1 hypothetical protein GCM10018980_53750 [Streptomyces capoamus]